MQLHISRLNIKGKPCFSLLLRQATGIILIVICQALATETAKSGNEKCKLNPNGTIQQYTGSMYLLTGTAFVTGVVFIAFFKPKYKRLAEEEKLAAEKILRNPQTWIFKCSGGELQRHETLNIWKTWKLEIKSMCVSQSTQATATHLFLILFRVSGMALLLCLFHLHLSLILACAFLWWDSFYSLMKSDLC